MSITKSRGASRALMIVVIVVCLFGGGVRSVAQRAKRAEKYFYTAKEGQSGQADFNARISLAANLKVVAGRYLSENDAVLVGLDTAVTQAQAAEDVRQIVTADAALGTAFETAYGVLGNLSLSSADSNYRQELHDDFASYGYILRHSTYNGQATDFNRNVLGSFPGSAWASLFHIEALPLFQ